MRLRRRRESHLEPPYDSYFISLFQLDRREGSRAFCCSHRSLGSNAIAKIRNTVSSSGYPHTVKTRSGTRGFTENWPQNRLSSTVDRLEDKPPTFLPMRPEQTKRYECLSSPAEEVDKLIRSEWSNGGMAAAS